ncbi:MAG: O-antigen ligase family protein [Methylotetracoccus sp.]
MAAYLTPLLHFQRFFIPGLLLLLVWSLWRIAFRKDQAIGLALYVGLLIIVDGFMNTGMYLPGLEKGSIRFSELCALLLWFNRPPAPPDQPPRAFVRRCVAGYFLLLFLAVFRAEPMMKALFEYRGIVIPQIIAFSIAIRGLHSSEDYRRFFLGLMALVIIIGLFSFWDIFFDRWLLKSDMLGKPEYYVNRKHGRFGSFLLNPNFLGAFVVLVFPVSFIWWLRERSGFFRMFALVGLLSLVFSLVETQSRAPLAAFAASVMLLVVGPCGGLSRRRRLAILSVFVLVFSLAMPGFYKHAIERFSALDEETTEESASRKTMWTYTRGIIADNPLLGIGFGEMQYRDALQAAGYEEKYGRLFDNPHNSYLQAASYAGLPVLILFLLANAALLRRSILISARGGAGDETPTVFGLTVGVTGFLVCSYPDMHMFTVNVGPTYWVFFGILLSLVTKPRPPNPSETSAS